MVHGGSCYYVANASNASIWNNSRESCQDLGADLAVIKSEDENRFVYDLLRNSIDNRNRWIRLYRKADDKFSWLDDGPAEGNYHNWGDCEPNNKGGENCVILRAGNHNGAWNNILCSSDGPVVFKANFFIAKLFSQI